MIVNTKNVHKLFENTLKLSNLEMLLLLREALPEYQLPEEKKKGFWKEYLKVLADGDVAREWKEFESFWKELVFLAGPLNFQDEEIKIFMGRRLEKLSYSYADFKRGGLARSNVFLFYKLADEGVVNMLMNAHYNKTGKHLLPQIVESNNLEMLDEVLKKPEGCDVNAFYQKSDDNSGTSEKRRIYLNIKKNETLERLMTAGLNPNLPLMDKLPEGAKDVNASIRGNNLEQMLIAKTVRNGAEYLRSGQGHLFPRSETLEMLKTIGLDENSDGVRLVKVFGAAKPYMRTVCSEDVSKLEACLKEWCAPMKTPFYKEAAGSPFEWFSLQSEYFLQEFRTLSIEKIEGAVDKFANKEQKNAFIRHLLYYGKGGFDDHEGAHACVKKHLMNHLEEFLEAMPKKWEESQRELILSKELSGPIFWNAKNKKTGETFLDIFKRHANAGPLTPSKTYYLTDLIKPLLLTERNKQWRCGTLKESQRKDVYELATNLILKRERSTSFDFAMSSFYQFALRDESVVLNEVLLENIKKFRPSNEKESAEFDKLMLLRRGQLISDEVKSAKVRMKTL
jgi:hypothetical protein